MKLQLKFSSKDNEIFIKFIGIWSPTKYNAINVMARSICAGYEKLQIISHLNEFFQKAN